MTNNVSPLSDAFTSRRRFLQLGGVAIAGTALSGFLASCSSSASTTAAAGGATTGAAGTGATASSAASLTSFTLQLPWIEDSEFSPLFLADANKHYASENVSMKFVAGGANTSGIEGIVAAGKADIGISTDITTIVAAIAEGNPLVVIGSLYQSNLNAFMSKPTNSYTSMASLVGKKIGGSQGVQNQLDAMFKINGLAPKYKFVPTGYGPDALINGDCDAQAVFVTDEALSYKREKGVAPTLLLFENVGLPSYTLPIFTTTSTLKNKRAAVKGFLKATVAGCVDNLADTTAGAKLAATVYGKGANLVLSEELAKNAAYAPYSKSTYTDKNGYLWVDPDHLTNAVFPGLKAAGLKTTDASKVVDMTLLQEIAAGK